MAPPRNRHRATNRKSFSRRRLLLEQLEVRQVMTSYISEVLFSPLFGSNDTDQYVELRGTPNSTIAEGTYFVSVEGWGAVPGGPGYLHSVINLSGLNFGANGFLVFLQKDSPFSPNNLANTVRSTDTGFGGLPSGRWSDASTLSNRLSFVSPSLTFMIVSAASAPVPASDIDTNDDGLRDGSAAGWTVIDSIGAMGNSATASTSYGRITFSTKDDVKSPAGTEKVVLQSLAYVGRVGASTGNSAQDWVAGNIQDPSTDSVGYRFTFGTFGDPSQLSYAGRQINHVGDYNFNGGVSGRITASPSSTSLSGITFFADQNGDGVRSSVNIAVNPSSFSDGTELTNPFPNATLTVVNEQNKNVGFVVRPRVPSGGSTNGPKVFASEGIPWFSNGSRLRVEFYQPASAVSIVSIGASALSDSYGRLEIYNSRDELIAFAQTGPMRAGARQRLSFDRPLADIQYAIAYTNNTIPDSSPFGPFDALTYSYPEFATTSNAQGKFELEELPPGNYRILPANAPSGLLLNGGPVQLDVTNFEHILGPSFDFVPNRPPVISSVNFSLPENSPPGSVAGSVLAMDPDVGQTLQYAINPESNRFAVNSSTGQITLLNSGIWDFESTSPVVLNVQVSDSNVPPALTTKAITISPSDVNERPVAPNLTVQLDENSALDTLVATVAGVDPDVNGTSTIRYSISGLAVGFPFSINTSTGAIRVSNPALLDYESRKAWSIPVVIQDGLASTLSSTSTVTVQIRDVNEPPAISNQSFTILEQSPLGTLVGTVRFENPELDQAMNFQVLSGSGADRFEVNSQSGEIRVSTASLPYNPLTAVSTLIVQINETSDSTKFAVATITISVSDVNDPPAIAPQSFSVSERIARGTRVGTILASDPNANQTITLTVLTPLSATPFEWNATDSSFVVRTNATLDAVVQDRYVFTVRANDNATPPLSSVAQITIQLIEENDPPILSESTLKVNENSAAGMLVGTIPVSDRNRNESVTLEVKGANASRFEFESGTNRLFVSANANLDFEQTQTHVVQISATDKSGAVTTRDYVVAISNVNEAPTVSPVSLPKIIAAAGEQMKIDLDTRVFSDPEGGLLTYTLTLNDSVLPNWITFDSVTKSLTIRAWNGDDANYRLSLWGTDAEGLKAKMEMDFEVLRNATPWTNKKGNMDVDGNGFVGPLDILLIINYLNKPAFTTIPIDIRTRPYYLDVNGDLEVAPLDVLLIINALNIRVVPGNSEGGNSLENIYETIAFDQFEQQRRRRISN